MRRLLAIVASGVLLVMVVAGCTALSSALKAGATAKAHPAKARTDSQSKSKSNHAKKSPAAPQPAAAGGSGTLRVLVEPAAGVGAIYKLITGAKSSIDLTMYELRDTTAEDDLAADAKRGVDVRVILDQHLEKSRNTATYDFLSAHRVHVTWADSGTTYHQKTLTVDGKTSVVMTLNMVTEDYSGTRDFAIIDTSPADVAAIVTTFNADFAHRSITPPDGADLVWSPTNSQASILAVINGAKHTLVGGERGDGRPDHHLGAGGGGPARRRREGRDDGGERVGLRVRPVGQGRRARPTLRRQRQGAVHPREGGRRRRRPAGASSCSSARRTSRRLPWTTTGNSASAPPTRP